MPKKMVCKDCGAVVNFSPFTTITYMNKQKVVEQTCDPCLQKMVIEGKEKLQELLVKMKTDDRDRKKLEANRLLQRQLDDEQKKREKAKKRIIDD